MSFLKEVKLGDLLRKKIVTETTYNSGRKVKEDGYLSGLGVNHKCSCRDVLSLGEVFERNWVKQKDSMGSETQHLDGLGTYDNLAYNTLIITTQRKRNRFGDYVRMHELDISAGPHGESGKIIRFPEGSTIRDVKRKAAYKFSAVEIHSPSEKVFWNCIQITYACAGNVSFSALKLALTRRPLVYPLAS